MTTFANTLLLHLQKDDSNKTEDENTCYCIIHLYYYDIMISYQIHNTVYYVCIM